MKTCSHCKIEQPFDAFQKNRTTKDGYQKWCKSCFKQRWDADPERNARNSAAYRAANYERLRKQKLAYAAANREREAARAREWSRNNAERKRQASLDWDRRNPDRARRIRLMIGQRREARMKNLPTYVVTDRDLRRLLARPCAVVGCANTDIQIDHVIPIARGGSHGIGNFQPLCASHNQSKGSKTWMEFRIHLALKQRAAA